MTIAVIVGTKVALVSVELVVLLVVVAEVAVTTIAASICSISSSNMFEEVVNIIAVALWEAVVVAVRVLVEVLSV